MKINLYGEDGYSLWVLMKRFPELLKTLGDGTERDDPRIVVFYRPSFGRLSDAPDGWSKQFGEFDLLIGTPECVYSIESKPDRCSEFERRTGKFLLHEEQVRRHAIFQTYRTLWQQHRLRTWDAFCHAALPGFQAMHPKWTMPKSVNELGKNLEFILRSLEPCGDRVQDTILFFHRSCTLPCLSNGQGFTCVSMHLEFDGSSNFVQIDNTVPVP
jgi:hypothetical protein